MTERSTHDVDTTGEAGSRSNTEHAEPAFYDCDLVEFYFPLGLPEGFM